MIDILHPQQHENLTLAINSAKAIGCVVIGIDSHTLNSSQGKKWLVLGLVWQLIKMYLFKTISISQVPGLVNLLREGESSQKYGFYLDKKKSTFQVRILEN